MPRRDVTPIADIGRRAPEAGRIRIGVKTGRAMKSIDRFRFTSQHEDLIRRLAELYGGTAKPWSDERARIKDQFEVITEATAIPVYLPANGLTQHYELWSGGGCLRRCDGVSVETVQMRGDGAEYDSSPCICAAKDMMECKPYTRLSVVIPEIPFAGTWRLETKGWNALAELPGMFDMVRALDEGGVMVQAVLGVERRTDTVAGRKREFVVPTLAVRQSPLEIQAGQAEVRAIAAGGTKELGPTTRAELPPAAEREVVTGEIVESLSASVLRDLLEDDASECGLDPEAFLAAIENAPGGLAEHGARIHADIAAGRMKPVKIKADGSIQWKRGDQ